MKTQVLKLVDIKPADYNPRVMLTEKDQEYKALSASIEDNGLVLPLIVNLRDHVLISGHQRLNVLLASGETETEAVVVDMNPDQAKALCIALNKLDGEWENGRLADLLQELSEEGVSLLDTGFTKQEISELLSDLEEAEGEDEPPCVDKKKDTKEGIKCIVGDYEFRISEDEFDDLIADVRELVGFTQELVCNELKRRIFDAV